jgi:hypothetical protein
MRTKIWRKWIIAFSISVLLFAGAVFCFQSMVDPFGVWGAENRPGFNNYKISQKKTERLFKIYQFARSEPRVVFWGSSRLNYCTPAEWPGMADGEVYNFGLNAVHIPEMKRYFDAAMDIHVPEKVVFGLDLLQFSQQFNEPREGFSENRLKMFYLSAPTAFFYKLGDTVFSFDAIRRSFETIEASKEYPGKEIYVNGWDSRAGRQGAGPSGRYRRLLWKYHRSTYRVFGWSEENWDLFVEVVERARRDRADSIFYLNPVSADFLMAYDVNGHWSASERLKRKLVELGPVWDFNYVNSVTINRRNYIDPSHFKPEIARRVIKIISGSDIPSDDFGMLLTKDNISRELEKQRKHYEEWASKNPELMNLMEQSHTWKKTKKNNRKFDEKAILAINKR